MGILDLFSLKGKMHWLPAPGRAWDPAWRSPLRRPAPTSRCTTTTRFSIRTIEEVKKTGVKYITRSGDVCDKAVSPDAGGRHGEGVRLDRHPGEQRWNHQARPSREHSEEFWNTVINTNLNAVWFLSQYAGRLMLAQGHGKIINTASLLSFQGGILVPGYAAAKGAVAQLTKALANEWADKGINVNAIAPGYMATDNTAALRADAVRSAAILSRIPMGRWGLPSDLAGAAVFLASEAGNYIQGHVLVVDGGWLCR